MRRIGVVAYWMLPVILVVVQAAFAVGAMHQIRHEELGASVCNPYWLTHRAIYDGISSNVGWYGLLMLVYETCGFTLFTAKVVRVVLYALGILCVARLIERWFGRARGAPLLAVWGIGPTLLYLDTLQAEYGLDLSYLPIVVWLLAGVRFTGRPLDLLRQAAAWGIAMLACLSYPVFVFYLPALVIWYVVRMRREPGLARETSALASLAAFGTVFVIPLIYLKDPMVWISDPSTGSGVFRGAGGIQLDLGVFGRSLGLVLRDLFVGGSSYYFELRHVDFGHPVSQLALAGLAGTAVVVGLRGAPSYRLPVLLVGLTLACNFLLPNWDDRFPGLRRATGSIAGLYGLIAVAWHWAGGARGRRRLVPIVLLCALGAHHVWMLPRNHAALRERSAWAESQWFTRRPTPTGSLDIWLDDTRRGEPLMAPHPVTRQTIQLNYSEIYPALAGYRRWNGLPDVPIRAYHAQRNALIVLDVSRWKTDFPD